MTAAAPHHPVTPLLEMRGVEAGYGPFRALFDVSLRIDPGRVVAVLGSNGSGKTTTARVCSGLIAPTSGELLFEGTDITGMRTYRVARLGIAHAPEGRSVFASLSVEENLLLAFRVELGRKYAGGAVTRAYELFPRLGERRKQLAGTLSGGEQRMLALARVLVNPPRLLIADELSLGLAPIVVKSLVPTLEQVAASGVGVLLIEQFAHVALALAKTAYVLEGGRVRYHGTAADLRSRPDVLHSAYLAAAAAPQGPAAADGDARPD
jgi:branched-chain amino acid transport system ATP-binding protein